MQGFIGLLWVGFIDELQEVQELLISILRIAFSCKFFIGNLKCSGQRGSAMVDVIVCLAFRASEV